jgi:hypothetical protein
MMTHCVPVHTRNAQLLEEGLNVDDLKNITITHHFGNTSVRRRLEVLPLEEYTSILIFADQAYEEDAMQADSHSLATLVLIRDIQSMRQKAVTCPITCEVLDSRTHRMITKQRQLSLLSEFVQSNKFVARILAMVGEQRSVIKILNELLSASGTEVIIVPSGAYVHEEEQVSFWTVARRVSIRLNAVLIGFQEIGASKFTTLNPEFKDKKIDWSNYDLAILSGRSDVTKEVIPEASEDETSRQPSEVDKGEDTARKLRNTRNSTSGVVSPETGTSLDAVKQLAHTYSSGGGKLGRVERAEMSMLQMAAKCWLLLSDAERLRFGFALQRLGSRIKTASVPEDLRTGLAAGVCPGGHRSISREPPPLVSQSQEHSRSGGEQPSSPFVATPLLSPYVKRCEPRTPSPSRDPKREGQAEYCPSLLPCSDV